MQSDRIRERILALLSGEDARYLNIESIAEAVGISRPTASKYLAVLEAEGIVRYYHVGNAKVWELIQK